MDEQKQPEDAKAGTSESAAQSSAETSNTEEQRIPKSRFDEVNKAKRELEQRLAQIETEAKQRAKADEDAQRAAAVEQGKFKEAWEKSESELNTLRPLAEQAQQYEGFFKTMLERRLDAVPPHIKTLLTQMQPMAALTWLDENAEQLAPRKAPDTEAGKSGDRKDGTYAGSETHLAAVAERFGIKRRT